MVCTIGSYILAFGVLLLSRYVRCFRSKQPEGKNPWDARTLEWATISPPNEYNFAATPVVNARDAYWADKYGPKDRKLGEVDESHGIHMPSQSWMPLIASAGFIPLGLGLSLMQAGVPLWDTLPF